MELNRRTCACLLVATLMVLVPRVALAQGTVVAWGQNGAGQLGNDQGLFGPDHSAPVQVVGPGGPGLLADVVAVAAGVSHTVALKGDGTVWAWGQGTYGALGDGGVGMSDTPTQVRGPNGVGNLSGIVAVAAGYLTGLALKDDGTVWQWGLIPLPSGSPIEFQLYPTQVSGPGGEGVLDQIIAIDADFGTLLALKDDGTVWAWGYNGNGNLGDGTFISRTTPVQVVGLTEITAIAAGANQSVALKSDSTAWAWGSNGLAPPYLVWQPVPVQMRREDGDVDPPLEGIVAISAGTNHSMALMSDGTVWTWGSNVEGQLGNGLVCNAIGVPDCHTAGTPVPIAMWPPANPVGGLTGISAIAAGGYHNFAQKSDGSLWGWGMNLSGQVGNGAALPSQPVASPVQVVGVDGLGNLTDVTSFAGGFLHSVAVVNAVPTEAPAITSASETTLTVGSSGSFTITTTGSPTPSLVQDGILPTGIVFVDNGDGTATLSGTPAAGSAGGYPLTITANNGVGDNAVQAFTLTVVLPAPNITIGKGAVIGSNVSIGDGTIIKQNAQIGDNVVIGTNVVINKNVIIKAGVQIGDNTIIDQGTVVEVNATIGANARLGQFVHVLANAIVPNGTIVRARTTVP